MKKQSVIAILLIFSVSQVSNSRKFNGRTAPKVDSSLIVFSYLDSISKVNSLAHTKLPQAIYKYLINPRTSANATVSTRKQGLWVHKYREQKLLGIRYFDNDTLNGPALLIGTDRKIKQTSFFNNGFREGLFKSFWRNDNAVHVTWFYRGKRLKEDDYRGYDFVQTTIYNDSCTDHSYLYGGGYATKGLIRQPSGNQAYEGYVADIVTKQ